jgi:hypothetical protein
MEALLLIAVDCAPRLSAGLRQAVIGSQLLDVQRWRVLVFLLLLWPTRVAHAQDLVPGAYTPGPVGFNVRHRQLQPWRRGFDPALPLEDGRATIGTWSLGLNRTLNIGGRYSSVGLGMPFLHGHLDGILLGQLQAATLSGQGDLAGRIAVNLHGAPAMSRQEFAKYRASTVLGVSLVVTAPVGRYNYSHYVNIGANRWSFKPELRLLRRRGRWTFEGNLATSFYTDNTKGSRTRDMVSGS